MKKPPQKQIYIIFAIFTTNNYKKIYSIYMYRVLKYSMDCRDTIKWNPSWCCKNDRFCFSNDNNELNVMIMHTFHNYFFILMLYLQCKCFIIFVFLILFLVVLLLKGKGNKRQGVLLLGVCDTGKTLMFHKVKHISKIFRYRIYIFYRKYVLTVYDLCIGKQKI